MKSMFASFLLGLSLAMDCMAIALSQGLRQDTSHTHLFRLALLFGIFQGGMLWLGWSGGYLLLQNLGSATDWLAALLLAGIGVKMLKEAHEAETHEIQADSTETLALQRFKDYLLLSLATSMDALAAGISLPALQLPVGMATAMTGFISFTLALIGAYAGRRLGSHFGSRAEILGGLVLIGLGLKVLLF